MSNVDIVLGADGFLGRHMIRILEARGRTVHAIGRAAGDLSEPSVVDAAFRDAPKADRIFHLVTRQRTGQVQYGIQGELLAVNARIHLYVLEAWKQFQPDAKLISTGSSCAYPELDHSIGEEMFQSGQMHPSVRGYGIAKQMLAVGSETYACQYGLRYLHLLLATVYGPQDHKAPERTHFMTGMIDRAVREKAERSKEFTVWGAPDTVRDLLYVDDQIDAILTADAAFENTILNCTSNSPVVIDDCARAIVAAMGWEATIAYPPDTFRGAGYKTLDSSKFLEMTGWQPNTNMMDGVRQVLKLDYDL